MNKAPHSIGAMADRVAKLEELLKDIYTSDELDIILIGDNYRRRIKAILPSIAAAAPERVHRCGYCGCELPDGKHDLCGTCHLLEEDQMYADREMGG